MDLQRSPLAGTAGCSDAPKGREMSQRDLVGSGGVRRFRWVPHSVWRERIEIAKQTRDQAGRTTAGAPSRPGRILASCRRWLLGQWGGPVPPHPIRSTHVTMRHPSKRPRFTGDVPLSVVHDVLARVRGLDYTRDISLRASLRRPPHTAAPVAHDPLLLDRLHFQFESARWTTEEAGATA